jgi:hypothetical protein
MKTFRIRIYKQVHLETIEFQTKDQARTYGAALRKEFAKAANMDWIDFYFEANEISEDDDE